MKKQDFYFDLPPELIAQYPLDKRSDSRLLHYCRKSGQRAHRRFHELPSLLNAGDLLVMNNSKVIPARVYGKKTTGGKVELLVERVVDSQHFLSHIKGARSLKAGAEIDLGDGLNIRLVERQDELFLCRSEGNVFDLLHQVGHMPLPPYIQRSDERLDQQRYQTVYARHEGSVAAPTAGLHFDELVMAGLHEAGIETSFVTLHVGAGTFQPVRTESIFDHKMHTEFYSLSAECCEKIAKTKAAGHRVIAVGTTAMRTLESAARGMGLVPHDASTNIFIYPGHEFKVCDGLVTNFHLPESTLLMLVSAFIGHPEAMSLYQEAIEERYRFFSYGDASLLL